MLEAMGGLLLAKCLALFWESGGRAVTSPGAKYYSMKKLAGLESLQGVTSN